MLEILAPVEWINLSGQTDVSGAASQLGLTVLLMANSEKSGKSILAGKEPTSGAFVVGLIAALDLPADDPASALDQLVDRLEPDVAAMSVLSTPTEILLPATLSPSFTADDGLLAATLDITGDPAGFFTSGGENMHNRVLLLPLEGVDGKPGESVQAIFLFGAPEEQWARFATTFERMMETITIHSNEAGFSINDGAARVLGAVHSGEMVNGNLDRGVTDIWTFKVGDVQYGTLSLDPTDRDIDLAMTVISPSGQVVAEVNSGYVGVEEVAADILLVEHGQYIVEIAEFFDGSGRYELDLVLTDLPIYGVTGEIEAGQGIQSELPENARHVWTFSGAAGQLVSIVLAPIDDRLDAILHLYDPGGNRLAALDEGFSGDAEVISGFELPVTGEYSIQVRSFAGNGGIYTLSLDEGGEEIHNFFDAGDLIDGDVRQETLRIDEAHAWFFEGRVGDVVTIEVVPLDQHLDHDLWLLDPAVRRITAEDRFMAGAAETIRSTIGQDGQYLLFVRDFHGNSGAYEVRFTLANEDAPNAAGTLVSGVAVTATLQAGQSELWYFTGDVDDVVYISLVPLNPEMDLLFQLQDPETNTLLEVDKALAGDEETADGFTLASDGQWRIVVREFFGEGGSYVIIVRRSQR
jgi:hypothetical protein